MSLEEKNWLIVLKRIAAIAGVTVPELLNDTWQCHSAHVDSILPYSDNDLHIEFKPN